MAKKSKRKKNPTAELLPSNRYRCRIYDKTIKKQRSFIADTAEEAETMAREWKLTRESVPVSSKKFGECIDDYIAAKDNILSPTTISKYKNIRKNQLSDSFLSTKLSSISGILIQNEINELSKKYAPKTVYNAHGLISATLKMFRPNLIYNVTLPKKQKRVRDLPSAETVIDLFKGTDMELLVLLGMWQGFRVSEIRGLKKSDFKDGKLTINRVIVTVDGKSVEKAETKTVDSRRTLKVPPIIQQMVDQIDGEYITDRSGQSIYKCFKRRIIKAGYPDMTFHDLRHLNASVMLMLGVPDKYAMERGGWASTSTLKQVYQETFSDERERVDQKIDDYFEKLYNDITTAQSDTESGNSSDFHD